MCGDQINWEQSYKQIFFFLNRKFTFMNVLTIMKFLAHILREYFAILNAYKYPTNESWKDGSEMGLFIRKQLTSATIVRRI